MRFLISPFVGAGKIKFGMTPDQVRLLLGEVFDSFKRTEENVFPCDYFENLGVFAYYNASGVLEAIEFTEPAVPEFEEMDLLKIHFKDLITYLSDKDKDLEVESDSLTSHVLGIGAYAPDADDNTSLPAESIIVFENGYYD